MASWTTSWSASLRASDEAEPVEPINPEFLCSIENRRNAWLLHDVFKDAIHSGPPRSVITVLTALVGEFLGLIGSSAPDADPKDVFAQICKAFMEGKLGLNGDPARGRYVSPGTEAVN